MSQYNISVVMTSHYENYTPSVLTGLLGVGISADRDKPILDVFHIDDSRYPLKDNYKIGFTGNLITNTPPRSFYLDDFMSILRTDINNEPNTCGVYRREYIGVWNVKDLLKHKRSLAGCLIELHPHHHDKCSHKPKILARLNKVKALFWNYYTLNQINTDVRLGNTDCCVYVLHSLVTSTNDVDIESTEKKWVSVTDFMKIANEHEVVDDELTPQ